MKKPFSYFEINNKLDLIYKSWDILHHNITPQPIKQKLIHTDIIELKDFFYGYASYYINDKIL